VRVALYYGDADYICNWFGGEAVSLAVNYTHASEFRKAGYTNFTVDGTPYGEVRQYGNFSFLRIWEAGHLVPFYQPLAALEMFNRTIHHLDIATGTEAVTETYGTEGEEKATHTEPFVPLPSPTASGSATYGGRTGPILPRREESREVLKEKMKRSLLGVMEVDEGVVTEKRMRKARMERTGSGIGKRFSKGWGM